MLLAIFFVIISRLPVVSSNIWCIADDSSTCTLAYPYCTCVSWTSDQLFESISCLQTCPTGYSQGPNGCSKSTGLSLFNINFSTFTTFAASSIGVFEGPNEWLFYQSSEYSPILTTRIGFYFTSISRLKSTVSWSLVQKSRWCFYFCLYKVVSSSTWM